MYRSGLPICHFLSTLYPSISIHHYVGYPSIIASGVMVMLKVDLTMSGLLIKQTIFCDVTFSFCCERSGFKEHS